jgi:hypothetical protein
LVGCIVGSWGGEQHSYAAWFTVCATRAIRGARATKREKTEMIVRVPQVWNQQGMAGLGGECWDGDTPIPCDGGSSGGGSVDSSGGGDGFDWSNFLTSLSNTAGKIIPAVINHPSNVPAGTYLQRNPDGSTVLVRQTPGVPITTPNAQVAKAAGLSTASIALIAGAAVVLVLIAKK